MIFINVHINTLVFSSQYFINTYVLRDSTTYYCSEGFNNILLFSEICSHAHASVRVHTSWSVLVCFQVSFPQKKHRNINNENYLFSCGGRPMRGVNDTLCWYPLVCIQVHSSQYCVHLFFPGIFRIQWKSHFRK